MATKVKVSRSFIFKAYEVEKSEEVLNNLHKGKFMFKSECHYYCEKDMLDYVKNNLESVKESKKYLIYKISTIEDTNIEDMLIEQISVKDGKICID